MSLLESHPHADGILEIRLDRPPVNALDPELVRALTQAVRAAPAQGHRALLLSGRPGMFSAGLDVPVLLGLDHAGIRRFFTDFFELLRALGESEIPIVAALTGHAPAGGTVLAALCDHRVMADGDYKMGFNEHLVGLPVPRPVFVAFERLCGNRVASEYAMQGRVIDGREAHAIGLVDERVSTQEVVARALAWARSVLALPAPGAVAETRRYARASLVAAFRAEQPDAERFAREWNHPQTQAALRALAQRLKSKA